MGNIKSKFAILTLIIITIITACKHTKKKQDLSKTDFIYLDGKTFMHKNEKFFPIMLNYAVCFRKIENDYYISPIKEYENPDIFETNTKSSLENQIKGHLQLIKEMGFNTIRLAFDRAYTDNEKYFYPAANNKRLSLSKDYNIILNSLENFLKLVTEADLKIMILIKAPVENQELEHFSKLLIKRFKDNPTIFAYDFFNEPLYFDQSQLPPVKQVRKKEDAFKIVTKWKQMMNQYAPNQLLTIGFSEPIEVFEWDPEILPVDFIAFHTYHPLRVPNEIYWYSKYTSKPWMIGETALPADGDSITYEEQRQFMKEVYRRVVDCGGSGLGWWEFQEAPSGNFEAKYTGILNHKGITKTKDGKYSIIGSVKPAANEISNFKNYKTTGNCNCMNNYYNMLGYNNFIIKGTIINKIDNKPIEGAVIRGWSEYWSIGMNTYSNENGEFTLYSNEKCIYFEISALKMSKKKFEFKTPFYPLSKEFEKLNKLPNQSLEYHNISYKPFLKHNVGKGSINSDFYIFNFDSTKFNQAKFIGFLGIIKLEPLILREN